MRNTYLVPFLIGFFLVSLSKGQEGEWSEPQLVEGINFIRSDYYPSISSDGAKIYFASTRSNNEDIYVSERVEGEWTTPVNLGPPINSENRDVCPSISADGRTLYFVSYNRPGGMGSYDIWYSTWDDSCECWSEIINAGPQINTWATEWSPSISHDGSKLYFASTYPARPNHLGGLDLYVSEMGPDGWEPATNLGINTYSNEYCPSIGYDDTTLYFASWHHHHLPCWHGPAVDLFVAYYTGAEWTNVANLCDPINTDAWERSPSISSDGDTIYFASRRDSEFDDIYYSVKNRTAVEEIQFETGENGSIRINISPNPFNSSTQIRVWTEVPRNLTISIYNILGQSILSENAFLSDRGYLLNWGAKKNNGTSFPSGIYLISISDSRVLYKGKLLKLK